MNRKTHCSACVALVRRQNGLVRSARAAGRNFAAAVLAMLALGLGMLPWLGRAQPVVGGQGFKFTEYYDPPHGAQLKSLLACVRAQRQPDGRFLITDAKYRTFRATGEGELNVEAPQCTYDQRQRSISSAGPFRAQTADGNFSIEGEGFLYQTAKATLLVSNRVHTIIHPGLLGPPSATATTNAAAEQGQAVEPATVIDIFSDQFEYGQNSGRGVYQGNVRVTGTNLTSTAGNLAILLQMPERRLKTLTARENVTIDYEKIHATGQQALYSADTDLFRMTGQPTWRIEERDGSGDELVFDRTNRVFRANGHAMLKIPAQSMGASGFLPLPASASATLLPSTNHFIEIRSDNYELRTNLAVFRQDVRVSDRLGDQLQGGMSCGRMTLVLSGTNELQKIVAEHQVVIGQQDKQFMADNAVYTATNGLLELTGSPAWRAGGREGKGDWMRVNPAREEMLVRGHAIMKLPGAELGQSAFSGLGKPKQGESKPTRNEFAEVSCQQYFLAPESALFQGGVRIAHPQMKWACEEITLLSTPELGKTGRVLIAEPAVVFDMTDDQGHGFHGTGDQAVYTHRATAALTNDFMVLTGRPAMLEATNMAVRNNVITLDLASHKLMAPGKYTLRGTAPAVAATTWRPTKAKPKNKPARDPF
jgi:lipopolysaccharide export system protein LptA